MRLSSLIFYGNAGVYVHEDRGRFTVHVNGKDLNLKMKDLSRCALETDPVSLP